MSISATPSGAPFWIWLSAPGNGIEIAPGAGTTSGSITTRYWFGARQFGPSATRVYSVPVRPLTSTTALSPRSTGAPVPLKTSTKLAVVGSDVVVVDLVEDEVGYCRSVSGTARRFRRETGPENQSEQGRDDENVPGEVVHAANLDTA